MQYCNIATTATPPFAPVVPRCAFPVVDSWPCSTRILKALVLLLSSQPTEIRNVRRNSNVAIFCWHDLQTLNCSLRLYLVNEASMAGSRQYTRLKVIPHGDHILEVSLNRPKKLNAMDTALWIEVGHFFTEVRNKQKCRCVLLTGQGRHFSAGIDLKQNELGSLGRCACLSLPGSMM